MFIELLGRSGAKITTQDKIILLSPPTQDGELKASRMKADVVVLGTPKDKVNIDPANQDLFTIKNAGEYESSGVFIYCISNQEKGNVKSLLTSLNTEEGITVAHLSGLDRDLKEKELEIFENTDVLIIPIGGEDVLDIKKASQIIAEIEPRIVIPMHFAQKEVKTAYSAPEAFLKEMGQSPQAQDKAKINKKDLPQEGMQVIYLQP